jgi:hypothetical protein
MSNYKKYLKYKKKYLDLKSQIGGSSKFIDAVKSNNLSLVQAKLTIPHGLLRKKADPNQLDPQTNKLPVDIAIEDGHLEMATLLKNYGGHGQPLKFGADDSVTYDGNEPLDKITINPNIKMLCLVNFNQPLGHSLKKFKMLETLYLGSSFNQPLNDSLHGLHSLKHLHFTDKVKFNITNNKSSFNQSLFFDDKKNDPTKPFFPDEFKEGYPYPNLNTVFHDLYDLNIVNLGDSFTNSIYGHKRLTGVKSLATFPPDEKLEEKELIKKLTRINAFHTNKGLKTLILGNSYDRPYESIPNSPIETLVFGNGFDNFMRTGYNFTDGSLRYLYLGKSFLVTHGSFMMYLSRYKTPNLEFIYVSRDKVNFVKGIIEKRDDTKEHHIVVTAIEDLELSGFR